VNTFGGVPARLRQIPWDAVVLHTLLLCLRWSERFAEMRTDLGWLTEIRCPKIALPQDEYDHAEFLEDWLLELGVSDVFSVFEGRRRDLLYPRLTGRASFHKCFTGYIDEETARALSGRLAPTSARSVDIVYRATHLPYWFGSHGQLKHRIAAAVEERARARDVRTDISTRVEDTIVGAHWFDFLMSGRTVLGCESGSSVLDRRGEIQARIQGLLDRSPGLSFADVSRRMPEGWDGHSFFALSPRHFEAVVTKTCQVLVEGEYEGVFAPDRHYLPLRRDFSNLDEILERIRDRRRTEEIAETAYDEIYRSGRYGYATLAADLEAVVSRHADGRTQPTGVRERALIARTRFGIAHRDRVGRVAAALRRHPLVSRLRRGGVLVRLRPGPRIAAARRVLTARAIWRGPVLRRVLLTWLASREARRAAGLSQLVSDLAMLGVVHDVVDGHARCDFTVELRYDGDRAEARFESRRRDHDPCPPVDHAGPDEDWPGLGALAHAPLRSIVWDHGAMGRWLAPHPATPGLGTWLGPAGQYRFHALARLAESHPGVVWRALVTAGRSGRPVSTRV
jgi:hypothetical protein